MLETENLASYGLGALFTAWQLRVLHKAHAQVLSGTVVDITLPNVEEFRGTTRKTVRVESTDTVRQAILSLFRHLRQVNAMSGGDNGVNYSLGFHYLHTSTMLLQKMARYYYTTYKYIYVAMNNENISGTARYCTLVRIWPRLEVHDHENIVGAQEISRWKQSRK